MIGEIHLNDNQIKLSDNDSLAIFDIDSISLLIGINGSGKTKALCDIINHFSYGKRKIYADNCRLFDVGGKPITNEKLNSWGVVYFTSLPFRPTLPNNSSFINASPKLNSKINAYDLIKYKDIISDFGIIPKVVATRKTNYSKICRLILDKIIDNIDYNEKWKYRLHDLNDIIKIKSQLKDFSNDKVEMSVGESKKLRDDMDYFYDSFSKNLIDELYSHVGNEKLFSVFSAIEWGIAKNKLSQHSLLNIIEETLDFKIETKRKYRNVPLDSEIYEKISSLDRFMKYKHSIPELMFNNSLNRTTYAKLEVELNPYGEQSELESWGLNNILDIEFSNMSSGQVALLLQIGAISDAIVKLNCRGIKKILLLIDEGDAYLHLEWQRKYISKLNKMFGEIKVNLELDYMQLILATHSPLLATDVPREFICRLGNGANGASSGFASPLYILLNESFGTNSIGLFAAQTIDNLISKIKKNTLTAEDEKLVEKIDNQLIKDEVERLIKIMKKGLSK
ncbi:MULTISPECIES: AAA family ATPase [unclassified Providencia]|uniref:AAA family ATPase n=1 Tax=unclassified Providencia TaxID=2633465 RepID=UPI0023499A89|nr:MULTISPECIES: AAA family ATPase [unclassified Providencia]